MIHKRKPAALAKQREKDEPINPQEDSPEAAGTQLASFKYDPAVAQPTWPESFLTFVGSNASPLSGPQAARWLDGCQVLEKGIKLGRYERIPRAAFHDHSTATRSSAHAARQMAQRARNQVSTNSDDYAQRLIKKREEQPPSLVPLDFFFL